MGVGRLAELGWRADELPAAGVRRIPRGISGSKRSRHPRLPQHVTGLDMLFPVIVVDGGVVGTWTRRIVKDELRLDGRLLLRLTRAQKRAVGEAAERYGAFLGMPIAVDLRLA